MSNSVKSARPSVAMVGKFFPPVRGGMEEYVHGLAEAVADETDLTVIVHAPGGASRVVDTGRYRIVECGTLGKVASQPISPAMVSALREKRYDIVHLHVPNVLGMAAVMAGGRGSRLVVTHHADMVGFGIAGVAARQMYRRLLRRAHAVTVLSLKNKELARDIGRTSVPFYALPIGLDPAAFEPNAGTEEEARRLRARAGSSDLVLAFVGRLVPYKGLDVLLEALRLVPGVACLIAGDGRERARLTETISTHGLTDRVHMLGEVSDATRLALLAAADAFVLPSINSAEAFGIVQVEAQLSGLPVITTDLPTGVTEVTLDGETGLVVPPQDARALAVAIDRFRSDAELRARMGRAGRARAIANYSRAAVRDRALEIYRSVLR